MPLHEEHQRRRSRNLLVAGALILFVILVMAGTMARMEIGS